MVYVEIRRVSDGEIARHVDPIPPYLPMWEHGNYSCDCNRELFFMRARGELGPHEFPYKYENKPPCTEGRYQVRLLSDKHEVIYDEFPKEVI